MEVFYTELKFYNKQMSLFTNIKILQVTQGGVIIYWPKKFYEYQR